MMAASFSFSIIRLAPRDTRDERINVGIVVLTDAGLDVRVSRRLERVRAFSAAIDADDLRQMLNSLGEADERLRSLGVASIEKRLEFLAGVGPIAFSGIGSFVAEYATYEERIAAIMVAMVEPEPAPARVRVKRSRLLTQMKQAFRSERVLAERGEDLTSHRIVPAVEMDEGLVADLVLKNGAFHVVETVDASSESESPRKALGDIGISALVLERARMKFGEDKTKARLVYSATPALEKVARPSLEAAVNQGATLTNWLSADDRGVFLHSLSALAEPLPRRRKGNSRFRSLDQLRFVS